MVDVSTDFGATYLLSDPSLPSGKSLNSATQFPQLKNRADNEDATSWGCCEDEKLLCIKYLKHDWPMVLYNKYLLTLCINCYGKT